MRTSQAATSLRVLVNVGDTIEKDQPVLELETDKATIEVPSLWPASSRTSGSSRATRSMSGPVLTVDENGAGGAPKPAEGAERTTARTQALKGASGWKRQTQELQARRGSRRPSASRKLGGHDGPSSDRQQRGCGSRSDPTGGV